MSIDKKEDSKKCSDKISQKKSVVIKEEAPPTQEVVIFSDKHSMDDYEVGK